MIHLILFQQSNFQGDHHIIFGETATIAWGDNQWPRTWVHIRRVQEGQPVELLTCVVENESEFSIDESIWDSFDELLPAEDVEVVVGFNSERFSN